MLALALAGAVALLAAGAAAGSGPAGGWVGYRGDGSGVFANSHPPVDCDMKTGRNILWRAPMPNWGSSSPVVAAGRVFALSEPGWKSDWPVLTCIDAASGKVLWERQVNHLPATGLDAARQGEIAKQWHEFHALWRELYKTFNLAVVQKKADEADRRFDALGYVFGGHRGGGYGQLRSLKAKSGNPFDARRFVVSEAGIHGETWHHGCGLGTDCIGMAFATPVSDGRFVYVTTAFSGAACYDLDGNLRWLAFVPTSGRTEAYARSPLLYRDLLVSDYFGKVVAFDKATGEVRWTVETSAGSIATPAVIRVGATDILLSEGKTGAGGVGVHAIRLSDGKRLPVEGWAIGGTQILADTDRRDVAYFCGRGQHSFWPETEQAPKPPVAVRFALQGDSLKAKVLWDGRDFCGAGGFVGMLYHAGKLYCSTESTAVVIDTAGPFAGKVVAGSMDRRGGGNQAKRPLPATRHLLLLAGDRFYGLYGSHRTCDGRFDTFATLGCYNKEGKLLGQSRLYAAEVTGEKLEQVRSAVGWDRWPFSYGLPFTIGGDQIYVRSFDEIICIGERR